MKIDGIGYSPAAGIQGLAQTDPSGPQGVRTFMDYLGEALQDVSDMQTKAAVLQDAFARGEYENVHQVIIAAQEAGIALDLVLAIRNQVVSAYQEIMRMQV